MLHIKPVLSVFLWLAFFGLVDADISWSFQHIDFRVIATVSGTVPDCSRDPKGHKTGELISYKIKCDHRGVYEYKWDNGENLNIYLLPFVFSTEDSHSPINVICFYIVSSCSLFTLPLRFDPCPFPFVSLGND